jgi:hypothetical protein
MCWRPIRLFSVFFVFSVVKFDWLVPALVGQAGQGVERQGAGHAPTQGVRVHLVDVDRAGAGEGHRGEEEGHGGRSQEGGEGGEGAGGSDGQSLGGGRPQREEGERDGDGQGGGVLAGDVGQGEESVEFPGAAPAERVDEPLHCGLPSSAGMQKGPANHTAWRNSEPLSRTGSHIGEAFVKGERKCE